MERKIIYYIVEDRQWVQFRRVEILKRFLPQYRFRVLTPWQLRWIWKFGGLRNRWLYFSSWRIVHALLKKDPHLFSKMDFRYFLAAVTSHTNLGGGLNPEHAVHGKSVEQAYREGVRLLSQFRVVSVNSRPLFELLKNDIPQVTYCPNGVDSEFFVPAQVPQIQRTPKKPIRIGWAGRVRAAKNLEVLDEIQQFARRTADIEFETIKVEKGRHSKRLNLRQMRAFYQSLDFYLCASTNEGTPNPALEAAACGIPLITTRVGNMVDLVEEGRNGFFVDPTASSIVERLSKLKDLPQNEYSLLSENIRASIKNDWDWGKKVSGFERALQMLTE